MTVQELIDKLQEIEDKTIPIVSRDFDYGEYTIIDNIYHTQIPRTLNVIDEDDEEVDRINAVIIGY